MKHSHTISTIALTAALGLTTAGVVACGNSNQTQSNNDSASLTEAAGDTWITTKVKAELATVNDVTNTDISVDTNNGVVTLTGVLPSDMQVQKAVAAAKSVKGVKQVDASGLQVK